MQTEKSDRIIETGTLAGISVPMILSRHDSVGLLRLGRAFQPAAAVCSNATNKTQKGKAEIA